MAPPAAPFAQANMIADLQLLSVGAAEASPTSLVITDKDRFMVNVGEGTQRLGMEHKVRLTRLFEHIFLTALTPECFGGLPGMLLTLADCGKTTITIHGPPGTRQLLRSTTHFMRREELKITVREYATAGPATQGQMLAMHALPLHPAPTDAAEDNTEASTGEPPAAKRPRSTAAGGGGGGGACANRKRAATPVLAWVGRTADVLGKFDVARAKELGIPPGPVYGQLKAGKPATLPDGRVVQPSEVVGPSAPGAAFAFVHCPDDPGFVAGLPPPPTWLAALGLQQEQEQSPGQQQRHLSCLVHYTGAATAASPPYQQWMVSFGPHTTHVLASLPLGTHRSPFRAARVNNLRLHLLDPTIFPRAPAHTSPLMVPAASAVAACGPVVWGENLLKYRLAPRGKEGLDASAVLGDVTVEDEAGLRAQAAERQVTLFASAPAPNEAADPAATSPSANRPAEEQEGGGKGGGDDVEVVFLGTGSAIPSKYRNVSGIYLRLQAAAAGEEGQSGMLLDCGEGSLGQLASLYEGEELCQVLLGIRAMWVSHPHADHHLGLMRVLVARQEAARRLTPAAPPPPVMVLAPRPVLAWLREFREVDPEATWGGGDGGAGAEDPYLVDVERMTPAAFAFLQSELGIRKLTSVRVDHCPFAFGAVIDAVAGWRLVYSGDTRPCERLVQAGKGAAVLIHEATFEASKAKEAMERRHSTVDEALDVARRMGAATVLLTHFSQRYPKFPVLPSDPNMRVCVAFDLMRARFRDLPRASQLLPALQRLFPAEEEEEEEGLAG